MHTYGIEIECQHRRNSNPSAVARELNARLQASTDPMIRQFSVANHRQANRSRTEFALDREGNGLECRSPAMTVEQWPVIQFVTHNLRDLGCWASRYDGTHMHFGWQDINAELKPKAVSAWTAFWAVYRPAMQRLVPGSRRANYNCLPSRHLGRNYQWQDLVAAFNSPNAQMYRLGDYVYTMVNPYTEHNTTEVRLHHGTLNATRMRGWMLLMQGILGYTTAMATAGNLEDLEQTYRSNHPVDALHLVMLEKARPFLSQRQFRQMSTQINSRVESYR